MANQEKTTLLTDKEKYEIKKKVLEYRGANDHFMVILQDLSDLMKSLADKARFPESSNEVLAEKLVETLISTSAIPAIFDIDQKTLMELESEKLLKMKKVLKISHLSEVK